MKELFQFGSPLAHYQVDHEIVEELNLISDSILANKKIPAKLNYNQLLVSAVDVEIKIPFDFIEKAKTRLEAYALDFHLRFYKKPNLSNNPSAIMESCWVVSQKAGEWNYLHSHAGNISGVLYLKIPKNMAEGLDKDDRKARLAGAICFTEGGGNPYKKSSHSILPKVGDLYLFPSDLLHTVYPFFGYEERRSFSFNIQIN